MDRFCKRFFFKLFGINLLKGLCTEEKMWFLDSSRNRPFLQKTVKLKCFLLFFLNEGDKFGKIRFQNYEKPKKRNLKNVVFRLFSHPAFIKREISKQKHCFKLWIHYSSEIIIFIVIIYLFYFDKLISIFNLNETKAAMSSQKISTRNCHVSLVYSKTQIKIVSLHPVLHMG